MPRVGHTGGDVPSIYLGIDPGASGGLAVVWSDNRGVCGERMPATAMDVWEWVCELVPRPPSSPRRNVFAVIEKVGGYVKGKKQPGSAMFNFGTSYGMLRMALTAATIPFEEATPQAWQKAMGIPPRKKEETKVRWKNRLKQKAQSLFPSEKVTLATADALLIAEYCRRKREGKL